MTVAPAGTKGGSMVGGAPPLLVVSQGDPAGVGPEIALRHFLEPASETVGPVALVLEVAAREWVEARFPDLEWGRLERLEALRREAVERLPEGTIGWIDPTSSRRRVVAGEPEPEDGAAALAALDLAAETVRAGEGDVLVTLPINKALIARARPEFRGHTDHLAAASGLERYGRDYLMAFLSDSLRVALLSTHLPLVEALRGVRATPILEALRCLDRARPGQRIAVAGLNPHAGEMGLLGAEDDAEIAPAVRAARDQGIDARGPFSPDSVFVRARRGEFDWVLAMYHDQGLIAVKTASFGAAANWTLGLPYLRLSVDHGTAYELAGTGKASLEPFRYVLDCARQLAAVE